MIKQIPAYYVAIITLFIIVGGVMIQTQKAALAQAPEDSLQTQATVGTSFTYQGQLIKGGTAVNGSCNLTFSLHDAALFGSLIGSNINVPDVTVSNGLFSQALDFGSGAFNGDPRYLGITINSCNGVGPATILLPRVTLTPAPYALALPGLWIEQNATSPNITGGHPTNTIDSTKYGSTISGGGNATNPNQISSNEGAIGGGSSNTITGDKGTIGGGIYNTVNGWGGTIAGGRRNTVSGDLATIGGGDFNQVNDYGGTISGGFHNTINGVQYGAIGGGNSNMVSGSNATVPGGVSNHAAGNSSFAAGYRAKANAKGCFVWSDVSNITFTCSITNAFYARASGGVRFYTNSDLTAGVQVAAGGGSWSSISDRAAKENFVPVDGQEILAEVVAMPIESWNYIAQDPSIRHMGPMAQDFYAAFGLGEDNKHIATIDSDGVALAAIQGLYEKSEAENAQLRAELAEFEARLAALEALIVQDK
ncbi:MAG: tail fiber domain-containing protein [Chloroflexota bacterium]